LGGLLRGCAPALDIVHLMHGDSHDTTLGQLGRRERLDLVGQLIEPSSLEVIANSFADPTGSYAESWLSSRFTCCAMSWALVS
jgi:hypothetical protein